MRTCYRNDCGGIGEKRPCCLDCDEDNCPERCILKSSAACWWMDEEEDDDAQSKKVSAAV